MIWSLYMTIFGQAIPSEAKRVSKTPEKFGTGHLDGVAVSEAGNNGVTGATLIPLLTLGIPGNTVTAILLGALMMQGLTPGPQLFKEHGTVVYTIMVGLIFVNIFMYLQAKYFIKGFVRITQVLSLEPFWGFFRVWVELPPHWPLMLRRGGFRKIPKGNPDGIVAPESANNAVSGGAIIPTLALGVPGSTPTALILSAFIIHGVKQR
jgi:TctA family transporter